MDPALVPKKNPNAGKQIYPLPWPRWRDIKNIQKVARYWCGGDCEKAMRLPPARFAEVLFCALAEEEAKVIEAENEAKEIERRARAK